MPEITLFVIATPSPGKLEQYKKMGLDAAKHMVQHEAGTLEITLYEENVGNPRVMLIERYASQAALDKHRASEEFKTMMAGFKQNELFSQPPQLFSGNYVDGHRKQ